MELEFRAVRQLAQSHRANVGWEDSWGEGKESRCSLKMKRTPLINTGDKQGEKVKVSNLYVWVTFFKC